MERIHSLLRKIQDIYYKKDEKQVIDIDLMLDYTRVLYADLLDARTDILAKQGMGLHLKEQQVAKPEKTVTVEDEVVAFANDEQELLHADEEAILEDEIEEEIPAISDNELEIEEVGEAQQLEAAETLEHIEATINPTEEAPEAVPEQVEHILDLEDDAPASAAEVAAFAEDQIIETAPKESNRIVINDDDFPSLSNKTEEEPSVFSEIHFELPEVKDKASESPKQGFLFQKQKDIRSFIGINDKYQFMNELFANNRTAYEESLDKLSSMESYAAAEEWLFQTALRQFNWAKDDETFQSLLQTAKKFFEA